MSRPLLYASQAFEEIRHAYQNRHSAAKSLVNGKKPIGCLGSDVPEELVMAAGFLPVRVFGSIAGGTAMADRYLEKGFDPLIRAQFEQIVNGAYRDLDHVIISNSSDALIRVFYYLRAMRIKEPELRVPEPYFFDFLHSRRRMCGLYNRERAKALLSKLGEWRGKAVTEAELREAIAVLNETRRLLGRMAEHRTRPEPRISGAHALQIIGAAMVMPKTEFNALLGRLLEDADDFPPIKGTKLYVTGSPMDEPAFYEVVESCGAVIVGEDHETGDRYYEGLVSETADPMDAIIDRYHYRRPSSSQATVSVRVQDLLDNVRKSGAQGVIVYIRQSDDAPSWDYPEQRKALEAAGIPLLLIDRQSYSISDPVALKNKVEAFLQSMNGGSA